MVLLTLVLSGNQLRDNSGVCEPRSHLYLSAGDPVAEVGIHSLIPGHKQEELATADLFVCHQVLMKGSHYVCRTDAETEGSYLL